jgi:CheY-like chemotaxis protein
MQNPPPLAQGRIFCIYDIDWRKTMFHILVVDDDKNTRMFLSAVLENSGYTVFTACDGEDALEVMDREHIDLVVLDIMMPKMDGYEFTRILRENDNNLPILMVSAKQLPADKHKGFLVGTDENGVFGELSQMLGMRFCNTFEHFQFDIFNLIDEFFHKLYLPE